MKMLFLLWLTLFPSSPATPAADESEARLLISGVVSRFTQIEDYQARVHVKADIPFVKMLPVNGTVYFKKKNKFRFKSKHIALLPKQGLEGMFQTLEDSTSYITLLQGYENVGEFSCAVINIIPASDTSDLVLGKFWIDKSRNLIHKSQITSKTNGTVVTELFYGELESYGLPEKMIVTMDAKKFKMPKMITSSDHSSSSATTESKEKDGKKDKKSRITIRFSDYKINQGLSDEVFNK